MISHRRTSAYAALRCTFPKLLSTQPNNQCQGLSDHQGSLARQLGCEAISRAPSRSRSRSGRPSALLQSPQLRLASARWHPAPTRIPKALAELLQLPSWSLPLLWLVGGAHH